MTEDELLLGLVLTGRQAQMVLAALNEYLEIMSSEDRRLAAAVMNEIESQMLGIP